MKRLNVEIAVGLFLLAGFLSFAWLSVRLGHLDFLGGDKYMLEARFGSIGGLKKEATVEIAGVKVGRVAEIALDQEYYEALVRMEIEEEIELPEDSIASIRTSGIIGDRFVDISPGGSLETLEPGGEITETESAVNIEQLVSKYIFEQE